MNMTRVSADVYDHSRAEQTLAELLEKVGFYDEWSNAKNLTRFEGKYVSFEGMDLPTIMALYAVINHLYTQVQDYRYLVNKSTGASEGCRFLYGAP